MNFLNLLWVYFKMVSWKRQINLISSYPQFSDENSGFTTLPSKALSGQVWFRYQCFCFLKLFIFNGETYRNKHFSSQKNDGIFHIFKVSRVPSGIAIFAFRVNWNYAYSPFKLMKNHLIKVTTSNICPQESRVYKNSKKNGRVKTLPLHLLLIKLHYPVILNKNIKKPKRYPIIKKIIFLEKKAIVYEKRF